MIKSLFDKGLTKRNIIRVFYMKSKLCHGVLIFLVLIAGLQPIFAEQQMDETEIYLHSDAYYHILNHTGDYLIFDHESISFEAYLAVNDRDLGWRWLNFYLYEANNEWENGKLLYYDRKKTGLFGGPIEIKPIKLLPGKYKATFTYEGNIRDHLSPCNTTMNIIIENEKS